MRHIKSIHIVLFFMAVLAIGLFLLTTKDGGVEASTDSVHYIAASKSLLNGDGYWRYWWGVPFASWPPLYPTILAGVGAVSQGLGMIDLYEGIRFANALIYGAIIYLSGLLFAQYLRSTLFIILGTAAVLMSFPMLRITVFVWSEPIYILISLVFVLYLPRFLAQGHVHQFIILVVLAALGSMQRYAGIGIIPFGMAAIALFLQHASPIKRLLTGSAFAISALPYVLWLLYIQSLSSQTIRNAPDPLNALLVDMGKTPAVISQWFFPQALQGGIANVIVAVAVLLLTAWPLVVYFRRKRAAQTGEKALSTTLALVATYIAVYMFFYYAAQFLIYTTGADHRHLSVILIYLFVLIFYALEMIGERLKGRRWAYLAFVNVILIALIYPASMTGDEILNRQSGCCQGTLTYRHHPIVQWLNDHRAPGRYYSNTPIPLFYTPMPIYSSAREASELDAWSQVALSENEDTYLIWFYDVNQYYHQGSTRFYYNTDLESDLYNIAQVEVVAEFDQGKIYRLRPKPLDAAWESSGF